ncbi:MAG: tetratricopeptide repeat protein, partial [Terriglobia bacterium]
MNKEIATELEKSRQEDARDSMDTGSVPNEPLIREELERILKSPLFTRSSRLSRFLKFVVEKTLQGETQTLKEYALAVEVFDKEESYEPGVDPLVRVEAGRLRNKLREYYEEEGKAAIIRIELPKGTYVPAFQWRQRAPTPIIADNRGATPENGETLPSGEVRAMSAATNGSITLPAVERGSFAEGTNRRPIRMRWVAMLIASAGILLFILILSSSRWRSYIAPSPVQAKIQSIIVPPLENLSGDPAQDYFADGMTYALRRKLTQIKGLAVIRWPKKPLSETSREFNADWLLGGAVVKMGGQVRIDAQLIERATGRIHWASSYQRDLKNILTLQDNVTRDIAMEIVVKLTPQERDRLNRSQPSVNPESYEAYLRGRYFAEKWEDDGYEKAVDYFQQAIQLDPKNALAYAELANAYGAMVFRSQMAPGVGWRKAEAAALKAVELDDASAEAHTALAGVKAYYHDDALGAKKEYERAFELNPNSGEALSYHAWFLVEQGRADEAILEKKKSLMLDPLSPLANSELGMILLGAQHTEDAINQLQKTIEMDPNFPAAHGRL